MNGKAKNEKRCKKVVKMFDFHFLIAVYEQEVLENYYTMTCKLVNID